MSRTPPDVIALIPARSGSKRIRDKNIAPLAGHPLIAYSIASALQSGVFSSVVVSTDSQRYARIARYYGAEVPELRPRALAGKRSYDIEWVEHILRVLKALGRAYDCFGILRPTSPFRTARTVRRAWAEFGRVRGIDSIRAVEKCKQHPGKMWVLTGARMRPLLPQGSVRRPLHSTQYAALPPVYAQNASLELAYTRVVFRLHSISGRRIAPFFTRDCEGLDINDPKDLWWARHLAEARPGLLARIARRPFFG